MEFHDHIWNHHDKCFQISTNMPGVGLVICEIAIEISQNFSIIERRFYIWNTKVPQDARVVVLTLSIREASVDSLFTISENCKKMSTFWNFMTIFGITMINTFKRVKTSLLIGSFIREIDVKIFRNLIRQTNVCLS